MAAEKIFCVGNEIIDGNNKVLLDTFHTCKNEMAQEVDPERQSTLLERMVVSVLTHFAREEENMERQKYPHLIRHQEDHQRYLGHVEGVHTAFSDGHATVLEAISYLFNEICSHIIKFDLDYARYLNVKRR